MQWYVSAGSGKLLNYPGTAIPQDGGVLEF
jgi:hypothetical protein